MTGAALGLRVVHRMIDIGGYDRALALSAQAFAALVPLLLVVATVVPDGPRRTVGRLGLPDAAAVVGPGRPDGVAALSVVGLVLLVLGVFGFTRSLQRTYLAAWDLRPAGWRGIGQGLGAAVVLVAGAVALAAVRDLLPGPAGGGLLAAPVHVVAGTALWWAVQHLLVGGRVPWRALLPGAVLAGVGQAAVLAVSTLWLPGAVAREAARYGLIGVAIAVLSWLVVLGVLLVLSAVVGAELARDPGRPEEPAGVP